LKALELLEQSTQLRDRLEQNTRFFREGLQRLGYDLIPGEHPICPIMVGDARRAAAMAEMLLKLRVYVVGFSYPVVPQGKARIRTQISAAHTREDLAFALDQLAVVKSLM
jgi:glycine C-acetyltransferase